MTDRKLMIAAQYECDPAEMSWIEACQHCFKRGRESVAMNWNQVTKVLPPEGRDVLVWTGHYTFVATAHIYSEEEFTRWKEQDKMDDEYMDMVRKSKGKFNDFGQSFYFDDEMIYWMELPQLPKGQT